MVSSVSKPYTEADFSKQITEDRNWRIKEISDLKQAVKQGDVSRQKVLLRALVTICYAHWEGSVRFSASKFLEHIAMRKLLYSQLNRQFVRNYFLPRLAAISKNKGSISDRCSMVDDILNHSGRRYSNYAKDLIDTKANLNSNVFGEICLICGVEQKIFSEYSTFIDVVLLKRRNAIAHGEETMIALDGIDEIAGNTVLLMRIFGDALENQVTLQSYKAA
jgi:hypothetical protein